MRLDDARDCEASRWVSGRGSARGAGRGAGARVFGQAGRAGVGWGGVGQGCCGLQGAELTGVDSACCSGVDIGGGYRWKRSKHAELGGTSIGPCGQAALCAGAKPHFRTVSSGLGWRCRSKMLEN